MKDAEYKGKIYHLRMGMKNDAAYEPFTPGNKGVVRDFVWKLSGRIPDRDVSIENGTGVFGASMRFVNNNGVVPPMEPGTKVTVTLAPVSGATYLDGTAATEAGTIHKTFNIVSGSNNQNYYINDIPVTEYHLSIESELNGVKKQVYVGGDSFTQLYEWIEFDYDPAGGSYGSYESGLKSPNDFLYYMGQKD